MAERYDVIFIGGGVIGASVLFQLTQLGCGSALLLESGDIAGGATARSSGIVHTHLQRPDQRASGPRQPRDVGGV